MTEIANDDDRARPKPPVLEADAHGQAALMLAESTLHALMENGTFTTRQAVSVVTTAQELKTEFAHLAHESRARMQASLDLLNAIGGSLESELT